jgi:hypothetical protein
MRSLVIRSAGLAFASGLVLAASAHAADAPDTKPQPAESTPTMGLSCPPDFLTDPEQRMFAKEGQIRSGPWHTKCFQNGATIYDRDHIYVFCSKGQSHASTEGADGHAIRFQFPPEVACVWER